MKNYLPALVTLGALVCVALTWRSPRPAGEFDTVAFGRLPTLVNGRLKPLDTVARTSLLMLQGRQRVTAPDGATVTPVEWLLDVLYRPERADAYQVFEIVHPEVLSLVGLGPDDGAGGKRFSLVQLRPRLPDIDRQARLADDVESATRTPFQRAAVQLRDALALYQRLQASLVPPGNATFLRDSAGLAARLPALAAAAGGTGPGHATAEGALLLELGREFNTMDSYAYLRVIPPLDPAGAPHTWHTAGAAWSAALGTGKVEPAALAYAALGRAWETGDAAAFNAAGRGLSLALAADHAPTLRRTALEVRFNGAQPFYTSMGLFVAAFLLAVASWLRWPETLGPCAFGLVTVAFALTTAGIGARMWLEGRPPVTNLYSSALFVGWGAVGLCLFLEYSFRNAIGSVAAGLTGFAALLIAHHLSLGGDTMEMMRAVLDSNFWLATHVVTITVGYSAMFLAGFLGLVYIARGVFTRSLDRATAGALVRMIYGIVCFATLFSLVGTVLGGIWADQSWGRFWGWDPKENGALIIVLWCAVILHARLAGLVRDRGLVQLAIFGNIVTAWSWFGVNMLGVGLHSYGFMGAAFWALLGFVASQLAIMLVGALPPAKWRSAVRLGVAAAGETGRAPGAVPSAAGWTISAQRSPKVAQ
jgi:ABC-type transport system involved in cytochrome c biogenesis permease subunit